MPMPILMRYVELPPVPGPGPKPFPDGRSPATTPRWVWWAGGGQFVVILGLILGGLWWTGHDRDRPVPTPPSPAADYDPAFVAIGRKYVATLGPDFAAGAEDGAKLLDAGQSRTPAYDTIAKAFSANRQKSFDGIVAPALEKVSPSSVADDKLTPEQNKALARAIRGLAKGAAGK